jgi:hypothetical protein
MRRFGAPMSTRGCFALVVLVGAGLLACSGSVASGHRAALDMVRIKAVFIEGERATHYTVEGLTPAGTAVTYAWTLSLQNVDPDPNKPTDPDCNNHGVLSGSEPEFIWHHGNKNDPIHDDNCDHTKQGVYGHQGLVRVKVTDTAGNFCTATYKGTNSSGTGPPDAANSAVCTNSTTPGGGGTAPLPVTSGKVTGRVTIKPPGAKTPVPLKPGTRIPNGSLIDTTRGTVQLAGPGGSDVFYSGQFLVFSTTELAPRVAAGVHARQPVVELRLAGGSFNVCRTTAAAGKKPPKKTVRSLWGKGKGHFRTKGRYAAATVRGTFWLTRDRCDGTLVLVKQGKVEVRDLVKKKTVLLTPGKSYLAAPRIP